MATARNLGFKPKRFGYFPARKRKRAPVRAGDGLSGTGRKKRFLLTGEGCTAESGRWEALRPERISRGFSPHKPRAGLSVCRGPSGSYLCSNRSASVGRSRKAAAREALCSHRPDKPKRFVQRKPFGSLGWAPTPRGSALMSAVGGKGSAPLLSQPGRRGGWPSVRRAATGESAFFLQPRNNLEWRSGRRCHCVVCHVAACRCRPLVLPMARGVSC